MKIVISLLEAWILDYIWRKVRSEATRNPLLLKKLQSLASKEFILLGLTIALWVMKLLKRK